MAWLAGNIPVTCALLVSVTRKWESVMSDVSAALGVRLYPDLVERGGLAPALTEIAAQHRLDLGQVTAPEQGRSRFTCAELSSEHGVVCVGLGSQARYFMIDIRVAGEAQARGDTTDLLQVARVAAAWRTGVTLAQLTAAFPFMEEMKRQPAPVAQAG
jgi:hypothetical protein